MLKGLFYARFHPERGPSVVHQYPDRAIVPISSTADEPPLVPFSEISAYVIPPYDVCNRPLSICANRHRVLGFPVSLEGERYERNRFTFNVCFVLDEDDDAALWDVAVRKTAGFFKAMEEEDGLLSAEEKLDGLKWAGDEGYPHPEMGTVYTVLHTISEQLNKYGDCCVRVDDYHVLNIRLPNDHPPAITPKVNAWDVPLIVRSLPSPDQWTWDLTLQRIYAHVDGIKHIRRIAELADVELKLVKRAIRELVRRERAILLDVFHFQAVYAMTRHFAWFVKDEQMMEECCEYVFVDPTQNPLARGVSNNIMTAAVPEKHTVIDLYMLLTPGLTIRDFVLAQQGKLVNIDVRRFITFGVIKGFLRRVHKYALAVPATTAGDKKLSDSEGSKSSPSTSKSKPKSNEDAVKDFDRAWKEAAHSSGWATPPAERPAPNLDTTGLNEGAQSQIDGEDEKLRGYLDGTRCLDEVCVAMRMSESKLSEKIRSGRYGDVVVFSR